MDRFKEMFIVFGIVTGNCLKSNMDRFKEPEELEPTPHSVLFKIQYG